MTNSLCRWGILGTASIAKKNWQAIHNTENGTLVAVASRSTTRSEQFIQECQSFVPFAECPDACEGYESLLQRDDVDAVYIPLPTGIRKEWVIRAAQAGKHVLCEKPCAVSHADLQEMIDVCRENKVQFMDGVMYMHSARMPLIRKTLEEEMAVGDIRRITSQFSFRAPEEFIQGNIRVSSDLEPHGCLGDLGWYSIRFALWVMNYEMPASVTGRILQSHGRADSPLPVPMEFSGELFFNNGTTASFYNSFLTGHQQWVHVSGTKGFLQVPDFVLPNYSNEVEFTVQNAVSVVEGCQFNMESHQRRIATSEYSNNHPNAQETNLFRTFNHLVLSGEIDPHWSEIAFKTQRVMDACLESAQDHSRPVSLPLRDQTDH